MNLKDLKKKVIENVNDFYYQDDNYYISRFINDLDSSLIDPYTLAYFYRCITQDYAPIYIIKYSDHKTPKKYNWYINKIFFSEFDASNFALSKPDPSIVPMKAPFNKWKIEII
jgi:hypothetical protein